MYTIIIGDGLTNDVLNPEHRFQGSRSSVGQREIARLMGRGKTFGEGPLPTFAKRALEAQENGAPIGLVFFKDAMDESTPAETVTPSLFVEPIAS